MSTPERLVELMVQLFDQKRALNTALTNYVGEKKASPFSRPYLGHAKLSISSYDCRFDGSPHELFDVLNCCLRDPDETIQNMLNELIVYAKLKYEWYGSNMKVKKTNDIVEKEHKKIIEEWRIEQKEMKVVQETYPEKLKQTSLEIIRVRKELEANPDWKPIADAVTLTDIKTGSAKFIRFVNFMFSGSVAVQKWNLSKQVFDGLVEMKKRVNSSASTYSKWSDRIFK